MARRVTTTETSLVIRLLGPHEVIAHMVAGQLQVMIPGAVITITDNTAMTAVFRAWIEAQVIARKVFAGADRRSVRLYDRPAQRVLGAVLISGKQPGPTISGKIPGHSPSRCGQVVIRFGRLTIVCDDRSAWESQARGWRAACETAAREWGGPDLEQVERMTLARLYA
jgi:hypothetical protein